MHKYYGNCFGGLIYLWSRGKIHEIIGISTGHWLFPSHYIALNKKGHALHFTYANDQQDYSPWQFYGQFKGVSKDKQEKMLAKTKRKVLLRTTNITPVMLKVLTVYCLLFPLIYLGWILHPLYTHGRFLWKLLLSST